MRRSSTDKHWSVIDAQVSGFRIMMSIKSFALLTSFQEAHGWMRCQKHGEQKKKIASCFGHTCLANHFIGVSIISGFVIMKVFRDCFHQFKRQKKVKQREQVRSLLSIIPLEMLTKKKVEKPTPKPKVEKPEPQVKRLIHGLTQSMFVNLSLWSISIWD